MYKLYYLILNEDYSTIHYIGITSKSLKERLQSHIYQCRNKHYQNRIHQKGYLQRFLSKHLELDSISLVEIESNLSKKEATEIEKLHIQKLKNKHPLKNTSSGGEVFEESAHIYKIIYQYDFTGKLLNKFNGCGKAANYVGLKSKSKINDCCNGKLKQVKGFIWRYENDPFEKFPLLDKRKRNLFIVYNTEGRVLFDNISGFNNTIKTLKLKSVQRGYNHRNPFTKDGRIRIIEKQFVIVNKSCTDTIKKVENYLKYNKALYINQISKGYGKRIKKITSEIIIVSKNSEYIIFKSLDELKKIYFRYYFFKTSINIFNCFNFIQI